MITLLCVKELSDPSSRLRVGDEVAIYEDALEGDVIAIGGGHYRRDDIDEYFHKVDEKMQAALITRDEEFARNVALLRRCSWQTDLLTRALPLLETDIYGNTTPEAKRWLNEYKKGPR